MTKLLCLLSYFMCYSVMAAEAAPTDSFDTWEQYLAAALKTLSGFAGMVLGEKIMFLIVLASTSIILLVLGIIYIAKFFKNEEKRRQEAYLENLRIRKEQDANLERMQSELAIAAKMNLDVAWQQDLTFYKEKIEKSNFPAIWLKVPPDCRDEILKFIYITTLTPEEKSGRIVALIKMRK